MSRMKLAILTVGLSLATVATAEGQQARTLLAPAGAAPAQKSPPDGSIWHLLGIPQSMERMRNFRDSRVNRDGNNPGAERKPQLKPLAHEDFLKEGADPLLQAAAKAKQANDLAPQKIKALKYIASLGCGCGAQDFEAAILAGMKDCVEEVRAEAVMAVITSASRASACQNGGQSSCQSGGHGICNKSGRAVTASLSDCPPTGSVGCATCGSCCTYEIQEELKRLAFKLDQDNCHVEPSPRVRALAEQALQLCPVRVKAEQEERKDDGLPGTVGEGGVITPGGTRGSGNGGGDSGASDREKLEAIERVLRGSGGAEPIPPAREGDSTLRSQPANGNQPAIRSVSDTSVADTVPPIYLDSDLAIAEEFSLECVAKSGNGSNRLMLGFEPEYNLPVDATAVVFDATGNKQICQIILSEPGMVVVSPVDAAGFTLSRNGAMRIAILSN